MLASLVATVQLHHTENKKWLAQRALRDFPLRLEEGGLKAKSNTVGVQIQKLCAHPNAEPKLLQAHACQNEETWSKYG
jgi:hypothetical protein